MPPLLVPPAREPTAGIDLGDSPATAQPAVAHPPTLLSMRDAEGQASVRQVLSPAAASWSGCSSSRRISARRSSGVISRSQRVASGSSATYSLHRSCIPRTLTPGPIPCGPELVAGTPTDSRPGSRSRVRAVNVPVAARESKPVSVRRRGVSCVGAAGGALRDRRADTGRERSFPPR